MKRPQKRVLQKAEQQLAETVRSFLLAIPKGATQKQAQATYQKYNQQWQEYCRKMNKRHKWLKADGSAFENRVMVINQTAERKLLPLKYYGKRVLPLVVLAGIIYIVTDYVLPYFNFTDYQLFN